MIKSILESKIKSIIRSKHSLQSKKVSLIALRLDIDLQLQDGYLKGYLMATIECEIDRIERDITFNKLMKSIK